MSPSRRRYIKSLLKSALQHLFLQESILLGAVTAYTKPTVIAIECTLLEDEDEEVESTSRELFEARFILSFDEARSKLVKKDRKIQRLVMPEEVRNSVMRKIGKSVLTIRPPEDEPVRIEAEGLIQRAVAGNVLEDLDLITQDDRDTF